MFAEDELPSLAARFAQFAVEVRGESPLYETLSDAIAQDPAVAAPLAAAPPSQRRPNLLFAAVHDLLLSGVETPLRDHYPTLGGRRPSDDGVVASFAAFVDEHGEQITRLVRSRNTQTNEVGRCAALAPALAWATAGTGRTVALVELGASAGLLLHLDRYRYRYGDDERGPTGAMVNVMAHLRRGTLPDTWLPTLTTRVGIDLQPLSASDPADAQWLRACVWPEHVERLGRLDAALATAARHDDVRMITGDVVSELAPAVRDLPLDAIVCVLHSATLAYLDTEARVAIDTQLDVLGSERDLVRIGFEGTFLEPFAALDRQMPAPPTDQEHFLLGATVWDGGRRTDTLVARSHSHGAWLEWLAGQPPVSRTGICPSS